MKLDTIIKSLNDNLVDRIIYAKQCSGETGVTSYFVTESKHVIEVNINKEGGDMIYISDDKTNNGYPNVSEHILSNMITWGEVRTEEEVLFDEYCEHINRYN